MTLQGGGPDRARRSPSLLIIGRLGASALALISAPIVARAIGPEGRGETAAALALYLIVPVVLGLGLPLEVRRQAATSDGHAVVRTAKTLVALSSLLSAAIAVLTYFTIFSGFSADGRLVASIGIALAPLSASWAIDVSVLVAHRRYGGVLLMQLLQPAVYVGLIVTVWLLDMARVSTVLAASLVGTVATFSAGLMLVRVPLVGKRVDTKSLMRKSLAFSGSAIAEAASSRADQILALPLIGAYQAGLYSVAATIGAIPLAIGQALGASYFAPIAQAESQNRTRLQGEAVRAALAAAVMITPLIALAAWLTIPWVFGEAFRDSVPVTMISLIGSACLLAAYVASMALAADGRGIRMTFAQVGSLVCGISALLILGPILGALGAAIASTIGYLILLSILLFSLGLPTRALTPRSQDFLASIKRLKRD
ncbi:lipopolysaccharide biosynthesis protein [Mycolicibacterium austroafricanum]|uniref:lipopolysaccharide biosynthesis protein n=1 Tax=Mycolicibacterium austroafricanum TaxID=39687 RepID=UPI001CA3658D|nr:oligosaccharide flippase family protein [Mycolicibacterium austroafricanum]QZT58438.1 oligosaccharide flippase family protein [Mycolicibacterium austroafricanum]